MPSTTLLKQIRRSSMFVLRTLIILAVLAPNLADLLRPAQTALAAGPEVGQEANSNLTGAAAPEPVLQLERAHKTKLEKPASGI